MSPKGVSAATTNSAVSSEYDEYGVGGGDGALLNSYYYDDESPVYFQMNAVDKMPKKPRSNSNNSNSDLPPQRSGSRVGHHDLSLDEKSQRLRFILEKKEYREVTWKYFHSFMIWKDVVFKDRPDIFHTISVDYIRVSKAVNASISDTTMMKVWNKELHTALETIFSKFSTLLQRLTPPNDELLRDGFSCLYEHTAISRKLDRLSPLALQVMLAVNHVGKIHLLPEVLSYLNFILFVCFLVFSYFFKPYVAYIVANILLVLR